MGAVGENWRRPIIIFMALLRSIVMTTSAKDLSIYIQMQYRHTYLLSSQGDLGIHSHSGSITAFDLCNSMFMFLLNVFKSDVIFDQRIIPKSIEAYNERIAYLAKVAYVINAEEALTIKNTPLPEDYDKTIEDMYDFIQDNMDNNNHARLAMAVACVLSVVNIPIGYRVKMRFFNELRAYGIQITRSKHTHLAHNLPICRQMGD